MASDTARAATTPPVSSVEPPVSPVVAPVPGQDADGHLATGWEPHRPLSDGYVRRFLHAYASSFTGVVHHTGGRVVRRDDYVTWDLGRPAGFYNGAMLLAPLPYTAWEVTLTDLETDLLADGVGGEVLLMSAWPTPDLTARGWHLEGHPPLLLRQGGEPEPPVPAWLEVRDVTDRAGLEDWEHVAVTGYPLDDVVAAPGALVDERVLADPAFHAWVGYTDGEPVAIGTSYVIHGVNVFALGATMPGHRGRGAWQTMACRRLAAHPRLPAMGLFSDMSRASAERLGFVALSRWTVWTRPRPAR